MIPQEKIEQFISAVNPDGNDLVRASILAGVRFAESELQKPDTDKAEFVKYCKEARTEFVRKFWDHHKGDPLERVMAEDLLIAYDQLLNRYNQ